MSQPPGQYGPPYGPPPQQPYGQPGGYPGGPGGFGPGGPGGFGPGGPGGPGGYGQPPQKKSALPWIIVGLTVVLVGVGVLLVVLLTGDDETTAAASTPSTSTSTSTSTSSSSSSSSAGMGSAPGGASTPPENGGSPGDPQQPEFPGSDQAALDFMNALLAGDHQTAYDASCEIYQILADAQAPSLGLTPADAFAAIFYETTLDGRTFTGGTLDSVAYYPNFDTDRAYFTLDVDDGTQAEVYLEVASDLSVCGFG
jgi:hypothetical protein